MPMEMLSGCPFSAPPLPATFTPEAASAPTLVCIGLCTAGRPLLLAKCLDSLAQQALPAGIAIICAVVDNDLGPNAYSTVEIARAVSPFPIRYVHEPRRGISFARNRVLEEAVAVEAEWVAFIDDDETAAPDWVEKLLAAAGRYSADVVQGPVEPRYPSPLPFWANPWSPPFAEGQEIKFAATGNVLFRGSLIRMSGHGLRFDEAMALSGGEDTEFFLRAGHLGARMVFTAQACVTEEVPLSRLTFQRQMKTVFRTAANDIYIKSKYYGTARLALRRLPQVLTRLVRGTVLIIACPLFTAFGVRRFKQAALEGGRNIFKSLGVLAGLLSLRPRPYQRIDGY